MTQGGGVMMMHEAFDQLRGRFIRARMKTKIGGWKKVAVDMGITEPTVRKFLAGGNTNTQTLRIIEEWIEGIEQAEAATPASETGQARGH
jgi:predicted transcriptional regulator